jgi:anti-anti-sigma factor
MSLVTKFIRPTGLLDRTKTSQFNQQINDCVEAGGDIVLIDFKDVSFMDSSGLGAVVLAIKTVQAANMEIFVCSLNNQLNMLFELSGLNKVIEIFSNAEEFEQKKLQKKSS